MKRIISWMLCFAMAIGIFGFLAENTSLAESARMETAEAWALGFIPAGWADDLSKEADFAGFDQLLTSFIRMQDEAALDTWRANVNSAAFPDRAMKRDDGLVLLMLCAEALGWNAYNARQYSFCTENLVDYQRMDLQLSGDYPYCDTEREIKMYFDSSLTEEDPIGNVVGSAVYWMQRRMDLSQQVHFLDHDEYLNFHLNHPLTREDAIAAVIRLYHSEVLPHDARAALDVELSEERKAILAESEKRIDEIRKNADTLPCDKTAYYVSNDGSDQNDGRSPETAWATLEKVNAAALVSGDGVYFRRGDLWRGQLWAQEGVIYSAYGEGEKPRIYASPENGADPAKWHLLEGTDNIWTYHVDMMDCGVLVFNEGEKHGIKVLPAYMNGYLSTIDEGQPFDVREELTEDLMFFSEADSILYDGAPFRYSVMDMNDHNETEEVVGTLYLRCDAGNPGEVFESIEFAVRQNIVLPAKDASFHNLCLKYTGFHCIFGGDGFDVAFCEIGWIGGSPQYYRYDDGAPICGGNGVECDGTFDHYSVTDCYIYQIFDSGVSNQDPFEPPEVTGSDEVVYHDAIHRNVTYARNVFANNCTPIEIFFTLEDGVGYGQHRMENVLIADNYFLYTGFGWFNEIEGKAQYASSAYTGDGYNASENFRIVNNVFFISSGTLLSTSAPEKWLPVLDGNTYVQTEGGGLAAWLASDDHTGLYGYFASTAEEIIREVLGDENGRVIP